MISSSPLPPCEPLSLGNETLIGHVIKRSEDLWLAALIELIGHGQNRSLKKGMPRRKSNTYLSHFLSNLWGYCWGLPHFHIVNLFRLKPGKCIFQVCLLPFFKPPCLLKYSLRRGIRRMLERQLCHEVGVERLVDLVQSPSSDVSLCRQEALFNTPLERWIWSSQ